MKKVLSVILSLLIISVIAVGMTSCSKSENDLEEDTVEDLAAEQSLSENAENYYIDNDEIYYTDDGKLKTDSEWYEDQLFVLAANEIGVERLENCAADATTVKYLITEPDEMNAWLFQYIILYKMEQAGYHNMEVKFVFYEERGNVGTKYLQTSYSITTLEALDLEQMDSYLELAEYAE